MKARFIFTVVPMLALAPLTLSAQTTTQDDAAAKSRITASLETALKAGIPVDLLKSKVAEGRAKGVSEARIAAAVEARLKGLTRASEAMKRAEVENTTAADLSVGADALEAGVSESSLIKITREAPAERRAVAIATLTGLVQLGHASDRALARVSAVVRSNAGLGKLNADVSSQLQSRGRAGVGGGVVDGAVGVVGKGRIK
jgi:hypothetical protein